MPLVDMNCRDYILCIYTGCNRRNGPNFRIVFLMLNCIEKPQNTYIESWTVWEKMAIENCGLPSCPRTIALSWSAYLLVYLLAKLRAKIEWVKCISFKVVQYSLWFLSVWYCTVLLICLSYFLTWNIATCILYMVFAMLIRKLLLKNMEHISSIIGFRLDVYLLEFTRHCGTMVVFHVFQWTLKGRW